MESRVRYARTSDGVDIAYASIGSGPPLLVSRPVLRLAVDDELSGDSDARWLALADHRSLVIWDHRGFGLSGVEEPQYTIESSLIDLAAVVDAVGVDQFDLLSHLSMCHTALAYAARSPGRVRRLALWNPSPPGYSPRLSTFAGLPDIANSHFLEYLQLAALRLVGWERGRAGKRFVEHMSRQFTADSLDRIMSQLEQLDSTPEASAVTSPTLVIIDTSEQSIGARSVDEALRYRQRLAALLPNAELARVKPGADLTYVQIVAAFLAGGSSEADVAQSGTAVILFADVVDSTALAGQLGDGTFRERSRALDEGVRSHIGSHGGTPVAGRTLGDGVLATFASASDAIAAALACARAGESVGLALHLGLHAGDVLREEGNVYGQAVSIAARVSDLSAPNEVLVSATVRDLARSSAGVSFEDRGERELKGVSEPVRVWAVTGR
jgi:class 3 adenylate cyclase